MVSKIARLIVFSSMLVFSLFFFAREKLSVPERPLQKNENVLTSKFLEMYGQYYFYAHEIYKKDMNPADLKMITLRENRPDSWLQYAFLMKVLGNDKEAFEGFTVLRRDTKRAHEINDDDVAFLSRLLHGEITKREVPSALHRIEKLKIGWFQHIVSLVLYRSSGMEEKAHRVREIALHEAYSTVTKILSIAMVLVLSFIAGIIIIIVSVRHGRIFKSFDKSRHYQIGASYLFETFILWLFIVTLLKLVLTSSGTIAKIMTSLDLTLRVGVMIALYILPCAALLYLHRPIIHTQHWREELYGARGNLFRNIAYGVGGYLASLPLLLLSVMVIIPFESTLEEYLILPQILLSD